MVRWGILGTGRIAGVFATGLTALPDAQLVAVGSRSQAGANAFADRYGVARRHASYEALAADDKVDAIYIATPHPMHADNSLLCLRAGKAVLCEKPFTVNASQALTVINEARRLKCFLMEAMWTRFLPAMLEIKRLVRDGAIGQVRMITADFGFRADFNPKSRIFDPALAGGGLLDVGIYPIALAYDLLGTPTRITGLAEVGETGTDEQAAYLFQYASGALAILSSATRTNTSHTAIIDGTEGRIVIHPAWWNTKSFTISRNGKETETIELPPVGNGFNYEAAEVASCLAAGKLESDTLPLDQTLAMMRTMDELRAQWGIKYPME